MEKGIIYHDFGKKNPKNRFASIFSLHGLLNGVCLLLCGACVALSVSVLWMLA